MTRKMAWEGRLGGRLDATFEVFNSSLPVDRVLLQAELSQDRAWAHELASAGVYDAAELAAVEQALDRIERECAGGGFAFEQHDEDVHMAVERRLTELAGPAGERLQTGRSRNDQVGTSLRMHLRELGSGLTRSLRETLRVLLERASSETRTPLPGLTHLQPAQVLSLAHYLMSCFWALARDLQRLEDALARTDRMPLGSASLAGTTLPIDRERLARRLGFSAVTENSLDAVSDRDFAAELAFAAAQTMAHLSRYAEDWVQWCCPAWGFMELPDELSTGSSLMPQKKNPDSLELIRGKAAGAIGRVAALLALQKGLPTSYNKDLQEDKAALFDVLESAWFCLEVFRRAVAGARFDRERMAAALGDELYATDLADYLVGKGLPFRQAHEVVGRLARRCAGEGRGLSKLTLEDYRGESALFEADAFELFDPIESLARRNVPGGTGPLSAEGQLAAARALLARLERREAEAR